MKNDTIYAKATEHRNSKRLWLQGNILARNAFVKGSTYNRTYTEDSLILEIADQGNYVVSGKKTAKANHFAPIIDIHSKELHSFTGDSDRVKVDVGLGIIVISLHHHARKQKARETSFKNACLAKSLTKGDLCVGIGMSSWAMKMGFNKNGFSTSTSWVVDRESKYLDIAIANNPAITSDTRIIHSSLEEVESSELTNVNICTFSLPCTGHSKSGKTKNKITLAEQHDTDATAAYGLYNNLQTINAGVYVSENVPEAQDSATYILLKSTLQLLGYSVFESILDNKQSGSFENRKRYWFVAVSNGLNIDDSFQIPTYEKKYQLLSEFMSEVTDNDSSWSENQYLKDKAIRDAKDGKGFTRQLVDGNSTGYGPVNRTYAKKQSTPPMVIRAGDTKERLLTPLEHALGKQCPVELIANTYDTHAHQGLGQGVDMFQGIGIAEWVFHAVCAVQSKTNKLVKARLLSEQRDFFGQWES